MRQEERESEVSLDYAQRPCPQEKNYMYVLVYTCVCMFVCICVYVCTYVYMCLFMHVPMSVCICVYVFVYMCSACTYVHRKYKDIDTHTIISQFSYISYFI